MNNARPLFWSPGLAAALVLSAAVLTGILASSLTPGMVGLAILAGIGGVALAFVGRAYSLRVAILGAFLALLYAGSRDFAYLAIDWGGTRVFIAEIVLVVMWASLVPQLVRQRPWPRNPLPHALAAYLVVGGIALVRCLPMYGADALRDSALCYYALTFPLAVFVASDEQRLRVLLWCCWLGWVAAGLIVLFRYVAGAGVRLDYDLMRYGAGAQALACISSVGWAVASCSPGVKRRERIVLWTVGMANLAVGIFLIQHRSLLLATIGTGVSVAYCCLSKRWMSVVAIFAVTFALILLLSLGPWNPSRMPPMVADTLARIESIVGHEDANSSWRMEIWKRALLFGIEHPLLGAGFGQSMGDNLAFGESDRVDPHNSYVAIFYRMGLPGILAFGTFWVQIIGTALSRCRSGSPNRLLLGMALSAHVASAVFAAFNVVLEGPYMGIPFWVSLGLVYRASQTEQAKGLVEETPQDREEVHRGKWPLSAERFPSGVGGSW